MASDIALFRSAFESEAEVEAAMDSLVITVGKPPGQYGHIIDDTGLKQIEFVVRMLGFLTREHGGQVSVESDSGITTVTAETDTLQFGKTSWLARCLSVSDRVIAEPCISGNVRLTFTFPGELQEVAS